MSSSLVEIFDISIIPIKNPCCELINIVSGGPIPSRKKVKKNVEGAKMIDL